MLFAMLIIVVTCLIYLSSIYLVKAENSYRQLSNNTEELEEEFSAEEPMEPVQTPAMRNPPSPEQPSPEPVRAPAPPATIIPIEENVPAEIKPAEPSGPPKISMDFVNADLKDVLKIFCQQSGLNFIAGENVQLKPITLYLNNVSVDDALNSIITANGLIYERAKGSDIFIVRNTAEPEIRLDTKIYKLNHAFAEDKTIVGVDNAPQTIKGVKETVKKLLTPKGDLSVDTRTNSLVVTDIPSRFELIEKSIKDLDSQLPQVLIEAKIVELGTDDLTQLGVKWSSLGAYKFGYKSPIRTYNENRTSGKNRSDQYSTITSDETEKVDILEEHPLEGTRAETVTTTDTISSTLGRTLTDTFTQGLTRGDLRSAVLSADDFTLTLSLLLTDKNTDIISNPNIVTAHSREAKITVGEQYPIPQFSFNSDTASWEMTGFEYRDIGIILRVTPYADTEKGSITLELHPEVSDISGYSTFSGAQIPIIGTRTAITNVSINNGDTLAIGGLIKDKDNNVVTKVPLLGDLPFVGNLFKHSEKGKTKTNLIIFITPHILRDGKIPEGLTSEATVPYPIVGNPPIQNINTTTTQQTQLPEFAEKPKNIETVKQSNSNFKHR